MCDQRDQKRSSTLAESGSFVVLSHFFFPAVRWNSSVLSQAFSLTLWIMYRALRLWFLFWLILRFNVILSSKCRLEALHCCCSQVEFSYSLYDSNLRGLIALITIDIP